MTKFNWVYMTAGNMDEAKAIGKTLVESKLAACVNIIENMTSIYQWEGAIREETEVVLIAKTVNVKVPGLIKKVKSMHSYENPCILAFAVASGNMEYCRWIEEQIK